MRALTTDPPRLPHLAHCQKTIERMRANVPLDSPASSFNRSRTSAKDDWLGCELVGAEGVSFLFFAAGCSDSRLSLKLVSLGTRKVMVSLGRDA